VEYIRERKKERRPFTSDEITNFVNTFLVLLEKLEKLNICHRDIKPENFLYSDGKFKLCDF
jgi:serine/threonine protein kinase